MHINNVLDTMIKLELSGDVKFLKFRWYFGCATLKLKREAALYCLDNDGLFELSKEIDVVCLALRVIF